MEAVGVDALRSTLFLTSFCFSGQTLLCLQKSLISRGLIKEDFKLFYALLGFVPALSVLIEKKERRAELALYVRTPKMSPSANDNSLLGSSQGSRKPLFDAVR